MFDWSTLVIFTKTLCLGYIKCLEYVSDIFSFSYYSYKTGYLRLATFNFKSPCYLFYCLFQIKNYMWCLVCVKLVYIGAVNFVFCHIVAVHRKIIIRTDLFSVRLITFRFSVWCKMREVILFYLSQPRKQKKLSPFLNWYKLFFPEPFSV